MLAALMLANPHAAPSLYCGIQFDPKASTGTKDFARFLAKDKSAVHKVGSDDSWRAALHDPHYPKD